jgi:hypothetical protein
VLDTFGDADESVWNVTVSAPRDITAEVLDENQFNDLPPDGVVFAGFPIEMTLVRAGKEPLSAGFNLSWQILGGSTRAVYDPFTVDQDDLTGCGVVPDSWQDFSEVYARGTLTGQVCIPIPVEDLGHADTGIAIHHTGNSRTIFGPDGTPGSAAPLPEPRGDIGSGSGDGTRVAPLAYGAAAEVQFDSFGDADGSVWLVTVSAPTDITDSVLAENQFNDPPPAGAVFYGFDVSMELVSANKEPLSAGFNLGWEVLGGDSAKVLDPFTIGDEFGCGVVPNSFDSFAEVFVGGTISGVECIPVSVGDAEHPDTQIAIHHSADSRTVFG